MQVHAGRQSTAVRRFERPRPNLPSRSGGAAPRANSGSIDGDGRRLKSMRAFGSSTVHGPAGKSYVSVRKPSAAAAIDTISRKQPWPIRIWRDSGSVCGSRRPAVNELQNLACGADRRATIAASANWAHNARQAPIGSGHCKARAAVKPSTAVAGMPSRRRTDRYDGQDGFAMDQCLRRARPTRVKTTFTAHDGSLIEYVAAVGSLASPETGRCPDPSIGTLVAPVATSSAITAPVAGPSWKPWAEKPNWWKTPSDVRARTDDGNVVGHARLDAGPGAHDGGLAHRREQLPHRARADRELGPVEHGAVARRDRAPRDGRRRSPPCRWRTA